MRNLFSKVMTGSMVAGAALLVAACGGAEDANVSTNYVTTDDAMMGNDVTAVDAMNGTDANLGMDANMSGNMMMNDMSSDNMMMNNSMMTNGQ